MFPVLNGEMGRKGINKLALSKKTGIPYSTLIPKLSGESEIKLSEARAIKSALGTDKSIDELFSTDEEES